MRNFSRHKLHHHLYNWIPSQNIQRYNILLNANCVMRRLCFGSKYISATVDKLRISLLLFLMLLVKASFGTQNFFGQVKLLYALLTKILRWSTTTTNIELLKQKKNLNSQVYCTSIHFIERNAYAILLGYDK